MENAAKSNAIAGREDISQFIIHLTRDNRDTFEDGATARENFLDIIDSQKIIAVRPHCLFNKRLEKFSQREQDKLNVACFTEIPLSQLHLLVREISHRQIQLEAYGFVFTKDFIVEKGGQPAIYINSYHKNFLLKEAVYEIFDHSHKNKIFNGMMWRLLPFINVMDENHDFSWEREWRTTKDLEFRIDDLVCVILPSNGEEELKQKIAKDYGIAVISPGWTYEQIVIELARQQKATKQAKRRIL